MPKSATSAYLQYTSTQWELTPFRYIRSLDIYTETQQLTAHVRLEFSFSSRTWTWSYVYYLKWSKYIYIKAEALKCIMYVHIIHI